jgi:maltooligosyltrehalose trehalohydrolase
MTSNLNNGPAHSAAGRTPVRRLPVGAEPQADGSAHFRVWAPAARDVAVTVDGGASIPLAGEGGGYFSGYVSGAGPGTRYRFRIDGEGGFPDPASRYQPDGPHGSSELVDPAGFAWTDGAWRGVPQERLVLLEVHIGTFTPEGSWAAAMERLPALAELGITGIEMMPVADFPGRFGWGYDGVDLYAPTRLYGRPDDLRRFIDRAHALGLAVILDVVYNHIGPDGNYLRAFAPGYFTDRYANEWGEALNFDGDDAGPVREFFIENAGYWIAEYHFDGLRLDATHQIFDRSHEHVLAAIGRRVREAARGRITFIAVENEPQVARLVRPLDKGGYGLDAIWNDDFHHSAIVALTGRREAYYSDYRGWAGEFVALARHGFLFQGQRYAWQKQSRGTPAFDVPASRFVVYLQNHDQIANSAAGLRGHQLANPGSWRAMTAYLLLTPAIPMLFQGQEFDASNRFLYFADHDSELAGLVKKGREEFLEQFPSVASLMPADLADPGSVETFRCCVLDHGERERHAAAVALHRDLIALRREIFGAGARHVDGAALSDSVFLLRYFGQADDDLLLIVNLGGDCAFESVVEPLIAPVEDRGWHLKWSSEDLAYGGGGSPEPASGGVWRLPGHTAVVLEPGAPNR